MNNRIEPFSGVYLVALDKRLSRIWFRRIPSHHTFSVKIFSICTSKLCCFAFVCGCIMLTIPSTTSLKEICSAVNVNLPLSILDISKTSFISPSRCLLDNAIFLRQFFTCFGSSIWAVAIAVIPVIAFIGVRIS